MSAVAQCKICGERVRHLQVYNGHMRAFEAEIRDPANSNLEPRFRWYLSRKRGAVPGDLVLGRDMSTEPFMTLHRCKSARLGAIEWANPDANSRDPLTIARRTGPFVRDTPLDSPRAAWSYRWPSSWAHISMHHPYQALCGARLPDGVRTSPRERERLRGMPCCQPCLDVFARYVASWAVDQ